jgi:hypothetical protein
VNCPSVADTAVAAASGLGRLLALHALVLPAKLCEPRSCHRHTFNPISPTCPLACLPACLPSCRILGGLAAAHDLSGDAPLGDKAKDLADRLLPAFDAAPTGLITNTAHLPRVQPDGGYGSIILAEMGSNVLEFASVSRITGIAKYREMAEKGLRAVHAANKNVRVLHLCVCVGPMAAASTCMPAP